MQGTERYQTYCILPTQLVPQYHMIPKPHLVKLSRLLKTVTGHRTVGAVLYTQVITLVTFSENVKGRGLPEHSVVGHPIKTNK